ncbi:MAG: recombinase family protein [Chloroflexota bacterium]|nr:recombinase family protein [Chloroflexota bacterium]
MSQFNHATVGNAVRTQRAAIYCRVSSAGQEENYSLATQEASCRAYAGERGWVVTSIYRDVHTGSEIFERPGLTALRADMRAEQFDVLLVHALDRLSRDQNHQGLVLSEAEHADVLWNSATEDIDNSPTGKILRAVIGGMAELERLKIAERTNRGKRARVESGKYNVGCRPPYGYRWDGKDKERLTIDPVTAPTVRRIFDEIAVGGSARQVALALTRDGVPTPSGRGTAWHISTIRAILNHPVYVGDARAFRWSKTKRRGKHSQKLKPADQHVPLQNAAPALVSLDIRAAAQAQIAVNMKNAIRNNKRPNLALLRAGHARCGYCGNVLRVLNGKGGTYYRCNTTSRDVYGCPSFTITASALDAAAWARVEQVLSDPQIVANEVARLRGTDPTETNVAALDKRIAEVERRRTNLTRRTAAIDDDELAAPFLVEIKTLGDQHKRLRDDRDALLRERASWQIAQERLDDLEWWCRVQAENLAALTYEQKRLALLALKVEATVWSTDHIPRFAITMQVDLDGALSGPHSGGGAGPGAAHVGANIPRGCARRGGRRAGRP